MENAPQQTKEEEAFDLGNFSDFDENEDQDACGGDNNHKSKKDPSVKKSCNANDGKTCGTECQSKPAEQVIDSDKLCRKCKLNKASLKYRSEPVCKDCYINGLEHRFRSTMRVKVQLAKKDDEVLCGLSGGQSSLALCKMISESLYNPGPRKMFFKAQAIHINSAAVMSSSEEEEQENIEKIKRFAEESKIPTTIINLEDIYDLKSEYLSKLLEEAYHLTLTHDNTESHNFTKEEKRKKLRALLDSLSDTGSTKDDMIFTFKKLLIADFAARNGLRKILFGDTAQKVAIKSLALLCKGRGADLFNQVMSEEKTFSNISIYRPMNDFLTKEVLVYDRFKKLEQYFVVYPKLEEFSPNVKRLPGNGSINTLLENFVDRLQTGFPSTVHTVLNTLNKIKPKFNESKICSICWGKKDKLGNILEKGSIIQYLKHQAVQEKGGKENEVLIDMDFESKKIKEDYLGSEYFQPKSSLEKVACFACGRIFETAKDQQSFCENLPGFIQNTASEICKQTLPKEINQEAFDYYFYDEE